MSAFAELEVDEPLPLLILVKGGDTTRWEELAKAVLPMLLRPEKFSPEERSRMAHSFRQAMSGEFDGQADTEAWNEPDYESGECLEWGEEDQ